MVGDDSTTYLTPEERERLAIAAKSGDEEAFLKLFLSYWEVLKAQAERRLQYYNPGLSCAEDIMQSAYVKALRLLRAREFDPTVSFYGYVLQIIRSLISKERHRDLVKVVRIPDLSPGESRKFEDIEAPGSNIRPDSLALYLNLIELICASSARPHQAIALFFIKILQWEPREFVRRYSNDRLEELAHTFIDEYPRIYGNVISPAKVHERCAALFSKMEEKSGEGGPIGSRPMKSFYGKVPTDSLSDWCDKVKNRVKAVVETGQLCDGQTWKTEETF